MKKHIPSKQFSAKSVVFMSAVLEYLVAEVLELGGNSAKDFDRKSEFICKGDILRAVLGDAVCISLLPFIYLSIYLSIYISLSIYSSTIYLCRN